MEKIQILSIKVHDYITNFKKNLTSISQENLGFSFFHYW